MWHGKVGKRWRELLKNLHKCPFCHTFTNSLKERERERHANHKKVKRNRGNDRKKERDIVESERGREWLERTRLKKEVERHRGGRKRKVGERNLKTESLGLQEKGWRKK